KESPRALPAVADSESISATEAIAVDDAPEKDKRHREKRDGSQPARPSKARAAQRPRTAAAAKRLGRAGTTAAKQSAAAAGKQAVPRKGSTNKAYDASRVVNKNFAGAVQQKSSAAGTEKAIAQMEKVKPGSARRGTLRVPRDQVGKTKAQARGRIRVKGME